MSLVLASKINGNTLCEKCPCLELFWSVFSRIWTEYGEILECGPNSVEMLENADQKNPDYDHFSRSDRLKISRKKIGL